MAGDWRSEEASVKQESALIGEDQRFQKKRSASIHIQPAVEEFAVEQQLRTPVGLPEKHGIVVGQEHPQLDVRDQLIQIR